MSDRHPPGEFELIERFRRLLPRAVPDLVIGPGDDCAAVALDDERLLLLTCDVLVEDRHFTRHHLGPADLGRRLAAVNLSDVAAMGGEPRFALLSLALPEGAVEPWAEGIVRGVSDELAAHGAALAGGNLSGNPGGIVADLALTGEVERERVLRRSGAHEGDAVLVTGFLGSAAAGLQLLSGASDLSEVDESLAGAHLRPRARVTEGRVIARSGVATAMIDLSDGLASDLGHLCAESGVGAEIWFDAVPVEEATRSAAERLGVSLGRWTLSGGEDYELLFTADDEVAGDLARRVEAETGTPVTRIGRITGRSAGMRFLDSSGLEMPEPAQGWDHYR